MFETEEIDSKATLEFKSSFTRETLETLCAFANTKGGTLLIGINDKRVVTGVPYSQHGLKDLANMIDQGTGWFK